MSFFQNPFVAEFRGNWVLSDRQYSLTFSCPGNSGRSEEMVTCWNKPSNGLYNLSGNDTDGNPKNILNIRMAINGGFRDWTTISINLTNNSNASLNPVPNSSAIFPHQIVSILNADSIFNSYFVASLENFETKKERIVIKQKFQTSRMKFFIMNGQAEEVLRFNAKSGVAEMPSYFQRSAVWGGDATLTDNINSLVLLDTSSNVDSNVINNAIDSKGVSLGYNSEVLKEDYKFLEGRSGIFTFKKITVDGSNRITQIIEYPAGAKSGDLAKKTNYTFSGGNTNPSQVTEVPYTLTDLDLINP